MGILVNIAMLQVVLCRICVLQARIVRNVVLQIVVLLVDVIFNVNQI
jgi:hypothetical protein